MASRAEQKEKTRNALIESWLRIIGGGTNFASISLREVAKAAGVVPTSFYRHFDGMDELGLAVVDQLGLDLRRLMRGAAPADATAEEVVTAVVAAYERYVLDNAEVVAFVNQARTGGSPALRQAIAGELDAFAARIGSALPEIVPGLDAADRETVSGLVLDVLLESAGTLLDLPGKNARLRDEATEGLERSLLVVLAGARARAATSRPRTRTTGTARVSKDKAKTGSTARRTTGRRP